MLIISELNLGIENGKIAMTTEKKSDSLLLKNDQIIDLEKLINDANHIEKKYLDNDLIFDTWVFTLYIKGNNTAIFNSVSLQEKCRNKDVETLQKVIKELIRLSGIENRLRTF